MKIFLYYSAFLVITLNVGLNSATAQSIDDYAVVINHEEQYSIWPAHKRPPSSWKATKIKGSLDKCQKYIEEVWTDMRPLSIQKMGLPPDTEYAVVINHEEQYSIWPRKLALPRSWRLSKFHGSLNDCTRYVKKVWTDMRPLSLRKSRG